MHSLRKGLRIFVFSNLAVFGFLLLLPALMITGDLEIVKEFISYLNKDK
ncbi:hypothetical protein ACSVDE_07615 [Pseudalkalibacillus sp. Hm43]